MPTDDYLIDTTILVDVLRDNTQAIAWVNSVSLLRRWVSVVTYFELLAGCRNRREQRLVAREMRQYQLLLLTEPISSTALSWFERLYLSHGVGFLDVLIGATALHQRHNNCHAQHEALYAASRRASRASILKVWLIGEHEAFMRRTVWP